MSARDDLVAAMAEPSLARDFVRDHGKHLLALLDAEPVAWRPIETAPKDGNHILLYRPEIMFVGYYATKGEVWCINAPGLPVMYPQPTHWMPLPARPEASPDYGLCSECGKRLTHPHLHRCEPKEASDETV